MQTVPHSFHMQGNPMATDLAKFAADNGVKYFMISFTDLFGGQRAKLVPARAIADMQQDGAGFAGFATWLDLTPAHPDMLAVPDPEAVIILPWNKEIAWVPGNCVMEGEGSLGNDFSICRKVVFINCTSGNNVVIKANSHIEDSILGDHCDIGPFARLRPGTQLGKAAKIGNFVETKKVQIGDGSKVNHLSYIGDTTIGKKANIGAGTITCNYDGVNKFKTQIGDGAFIGSNSSLVAPVNVGNNATVGAGSTVTKDVAEEELAIARGKQRNIANWARPSKK